MSRFAKGQYAYGFCDKTGFRYPLSELVREYSDGRWNGMLVGKDVVDPEQPQDRLNEVDANDAQSLRNPRPDNTLSSSRGLAAWDPVGGGVTAFGSRTMGLDISGRVGRVTVEIS